MICLVSHCHVHCCSISIRKQCYSFNSKSLTSPNDTASNLAAVCDQYLFDGHGVKRERFWIFTLYCVSPLY